MTAVMQQHQTNGHEPTDLEILSDALHNDALLTATLTAGDLKRGIALAKPAVPTRTGALPVLFHVMLEARGGGDLLRITASDLELTAHAEVPATVGRGRVLVNLKALAEAIKGVKPREYVTLTQLDTDTLEVVRPDSGKRTLTLGRIDEYPRLGTLSPLGDRLTLEPAVWARLTLAASTDEQRPPLTGVMVDSTGPRGVLVATDSYRLHHHELDQAAPFHALIPGRAVRAAVKTKTPFDVYLTGTTFGDGKRSPREVAVFGCAEVTYISRVIEADFPNWRQLVPSSTAHELEVDGRELSRALRTFPDGDDSAAAAIRVRCEDRKVILEQRSPAPATATLDVDGCRYWPTEVTMALTRSFLADLVDVDGTVRIECTDHLKPIAVKDANLALIGLLMPVRVS